MNIGSNISNQEKIECACCKEHIFYIESFIIPRYFGKRLLCRKCYTVALDSVNVEQLVGGGRA
jgi:hypothetical protein